MPLPTLVISLPNSPRRPLITARLAALRIPFQFITAFNGRTLTPTTRATLCDDPRTIRRIGRILTQAELGCAISHRAAFLHLLASDADAALILEDDAIPAPAFATFHATWQTIPAHIELLSLYTGTGIIRRHPTATFLHHTIHRSAATNDGACGYFIRRPMAARLAAATAKISTVADWPLPARNFRHYVMQPPMIEHDEALPSEIGEDRPSFRPPPPPIIRKFAGLRAFSLIPWLRHRNKYDGLYNYYERELRTRIKARLTWRYKILTGQPRWIKSLAATADVTRTEFGDPSKANRAHL